jgi:hypothetical protein
VIFPLPDVVIIYKRLKFEQELKFVISAFVNPEKFLPCPAEPDHQLFSV